jgi:hypothetical protein
MRGVNDRNFLNIWQLLYRQSCPSTSHTLWQVGDVEWRKDRHSYFGSSYALTDEVHLLRRGGRDGRWLLMIVIENWWDGTHEPIKTSTWARVLEGDAKAVVAWMRENERRGERAARGVPEPATEVSGLRKTI